jgi:hypothetical protein
MKQIRKRLTYANVMSTITVFLLVGGATALAASKFGKNSVGSKQIKSNAITTAKIKNAAVTGVKVAYGTLTGANINLGTLGKVPIAENADTVNGQTPTKVFKILTPGQSKIAVATISGFSITASCEEEDTKVVLSSPSSAGSVVIAEGTGATRSKIHPVFEYASTTTGSTSSIQLNGSGAAENGDGESAFSGATSAGTTVSGELGYDNNTFAGESPERCVVFGQITAG